MRKNVHNFLQKCRIVTQLSMQHCERSIVTWKSKNGMCTHQAHQKNNIVVFFMEIFFIKFRGGGRPKIMIKFFCRKLSGFEFLKSKVLSKRHLLKSTFHENMQKQWIVVKFEKMNFSTFFDIFWKNAPWRVKMTEISAKIQNFCWSHIFAISCETSYFKMISDRF